MPRKFQAPSIGIRHDVPRPYYFIRIFREVVSTAGIRERKRCVEILGFIDNTSRREAEAKRAELLEDLNGSRVTPKSMMTFADVAQRFLDVRVPQLGVAVQKRYPLQIRKHLIPYFGHMALADIGSAEVEQFCAIKLAEGLASWTVVGLKGVISAIFTAARQWKLYYQPNPCQGVRVRKRNKREKRMLTADQFNAIQSALDGRERFLVQILYGTGLRISEVLGLKWKDIDLISGTLTVNRRWYRGDLAEETKTPAARRVLQLGSYLTEQFRIRRQEPELHIFRDYAKPHQPPDDRDLLREYFRPVIRRLGVYYEGFGWHAFRRSNITLRQHFGATPLEAMRAAGHNSLDMTLLYTVNDPQREREQIDRMFAALPKQ
jgi:integrase